MLKENSRILVTGGAGFIGSNLCEALMNLGHIVTCLDNFSTGRKKNIETFVGHDNFHLIEGDIRDLNTCKSAVENQDFVLHQAALGSVPRSIDNPINTNSVNIDGFLNMLVASKEANIQRFIYAASSSTYGDSSALPKVEEVIGNPLSPYAVTKLVNEQYARVFHQLYGLNVVGLRYFNVFGRRQDPEGAYAAVIPKFARTLITGGTVQINGDGTNTRDFTYIENVIQANLLCLSTPNVEVIGEVFNVAGGERTSLVEMVKMMREHLGTLNIEISDSQIQYGPQRVGDIPHSWASIEKAKKMMGYEPQFNFYNGLKAAVQWYHDEYKR